MGKYVSYTLSSDFKGATKAFRIKAKAKKIFLCQFSLYPFDRLSISTPGGDSATKKLHW